MAPSSQFMKSIHIGDLLESRQALPAEVKAKCYSSFDFFKLCTHLTGTFLNLSILIRFIIL